MEFNKEKLEQLIVYIARRLPPEAALGHVKLMKLLMLSDFTAYQRTGNPITGATYEKWEHGHFPREWVIAEKDLDGHAIEQETVEYYGKQLHHIRAMRDPDMSAFTDDELGIVETVIRTYGYESASYLSNLSHEEPGWQLTDYREPIPYEASLIGKERPPEKVFEEFRRLHSIAI